MALALALGFAILLAQLGVCAALVHSLRRPAAQGTQMERAADKLPDKLPDKPPSTRAMMERRYERKLEALVLDVAELKLTVERLPGIWTEETDRANRAAERVEKAGRRSRKKSDGEATGSDAEASGVDAGRGAQGEVFTMPQLVGGAAQEAAVIADARRKVAMEAYYGSR